MQPLNFPAYEFRFKNSENKMRIFDIIRKKFVLLQPEEWVRQHVLNHLLFDKGYPRSLINVEKQLLVNSLRKRYDIVVYKPDGKIALLVECKSPATVISQQVFDQIARYNLSMESDFLMVTNGVDHYVCRMHIEERRYQFLEELPPYQLAL